MTEFTRTDKQGLWWCRIGLFHDGGAISCRSSRCWGGSELERNPLHCHPGTVSRCVVVLLACCTPPHTPPHLPTSTDCPPSPLLLSHPSSSSSSSFRYVGQVVLIEEPCATTRDPVQEGLPTDEVEWSLVHALLSKGKGGAWASSYCSGGSGVGLRPPDDTGAAAWLSSAHKRPTAEVEAVMEVVRHNAFGLETPLLNVEYGAAFYAGAAPKFNHACDPNCISTRLGGNMAIFACKAVDVGDELTHSYLPPRLLLLARRARRAHLHFVCACARCKDEPHDPPPALVAVRGVPAGHAVSSLCVCCVCVWGGGGGGGGGV
jgi:hypothetical protein